MQKLVIEKEGLKFNGKPFRIFSGAMHYFRIHPAQWRDRLYKLKCCGLNTVETYVPWNLHEPLKGKFCFDGLADVEAYVKTAEEVGLHVILRPSPFICSEWDFGGLPWWLLNIHGIRLRCSNEQFMKAVEEYYAELLPRLKPMQSTDGGPVIAMQIENEYGSYGNDKKYLSFLKDCMLSHDIDVPMFTSDGGTKLMLKNGTLDDVWKTVNFGSDTLQNLKALESCQNDAPLMCGEFWNGQGHRWGVSPRLRAPAAISAELQTLLEQNASVNLYMFHGGTTFGFMNGALAATLEDADAPYAPFITSYDTDAPLDEAGDPAEKYFAFRKLFEKHNPDFDSSLPIPEKSPKLQNTEIELTLQAPLFEQLNEVCSDRIESATTEPMETMAQGYGFILYRTRLEHTSDAPQKLTLNKARDQARVYLDGKLKAVIHRNDPQSNCYLQVPPGGAQLDILVENLGRINFGPDLKDNHKGITRGVLIEYQHVFGWEIFTLPLEDLSVLKYKPALENSNNGPTFYKGEFTIDEPRDAFLKIPFGAKGVCWINGFNLGRYWNTKGPQVDLYMPAPLLNRGYNKVELLELEKLTELKVCLGKRTGSLS